MGKDYHLCVATVNLVGVTYSEVETVYTSKKPAKPILQSVETESHQITVHFSCPVYDAPTIRAWFEVELDPPIPNIKQLKSKIYAKEKEARKPKQKLTIDTLQHKKSATTPRTSNRKLYLI